MSCNEQMRSIFKDLASRYNNLDVLYSDKALCTDNASMIGWMGWELINAEQDVCIRDSRVNAIKKLPLGNYVEGLVNVKGSPVGERVAVRRESEAIMNSMQKKQTYYRKQ